MLSANDEIVEKLIEAGLDEKQCLLIIDLASQPPAKASEIARLGLSAWTHITLKNYKKRV